MIFYLLPIELIVKILEFVVSLDVSSSLLFNYRIIDRKIYSIIYNHQISYNYKQEKYSSFFCKLYVVTTNNKRYNLYNYNNEKIEELVEIKFYDSDKIDFRFCSYYSNFISSKEIILKKINETKVYSFNRPYLFKIKNSYYYYFEFDVNNINVSGYIIDIDNKRNIYSETNSELFNLLCINKPKLFCNVCIKYKLISEEAFINLFSFLT